MATGIGRKDATSTFLVALATLSILLSSPATAQISIGTPKFGSFDGGQFDTVNLGNLNVHFAIPIVHKAGRGVPLAYDLTYDSSVWSPVTSGSTTSWQPATKWGWSTPWVGAAGYIATQETGGQCTTLVDVNGQWVYEVTGGWQNYTNWQYIDNNGVAHSFPGVQWSFSGGSCGTVNDNTYPATQASDSSGLILYAGSCSSPGPQGNSLCVQAPNGTQVFPVMNPGSTPLAYKVGPDANGNQITSTTGQNLLQITDTLGQLALTVSGISPITYQYTGPGGTSPTYKLYYTAYNVKTAFNCGTTQEYTATGVSLVSSIVLPDGSQYSISYEPTPGHSGYYTGRIQSITLPTGGTVQYTYTGSNDGINCSDGTTVGLQRSLTPGGTWQYARTGSGTAWTTTQTDPGNNQIAINFEETSNNNFYETQRLTYQGSTSGTLLRTDITCFNGQNVGSPSSCYNTGIAPQITRITHFTYIPDPSGLQSETDTTYNTLGLLLHVNEYDYGNGAVGSLIRQTITQYAGGMSNGIVDRPSSVTIEDVNNAVKAYTAYSYDESPPTTPGGTTPNWVSVSGSRGNLTTVQVQANGSTNLYRHYTYYNTGTLATSTDVSTSSTINGATTTYNYNNTGSPSPSCGNAFVTSISEPVGSMSRSFTWDCSGGVLTSVTDENGYTSSTAYSGTNYTNYFWRPYSTTDEAGTTTDNFYYLNTAIPPIEFQTESKYHTPFNNGTSTVDKVTTTDGFGKPVFSQTRQGPNASNYDTVATCYDGFGRVSFSSLPYSATLATSSSTCPYPSNSNGTTTTYDAMARTYQMTAGDGGQTTFSYSKNDTLVTRTSPTVSKQSEVDALGRLTSVCEITNGTTAWPSGSCGQHTSATGYLTTYGYDVLGNRITVIQNAQAAAGHQTRSLSYDMIGRLSQEWNPETNNQSTTYSYDSLSNDVSCGSITSAGNLLKQSDPAGNVSCLSGYDGLHRVGMITYPSGSDPSKHFVYDTATVNGTAMTNAKTRLAEAYTCIGGCSSKMTDFGFAYRATGQATDVWEMTPHSGSNYYFHVTATPWPNGAVNTITNLVGLPTITYGADGEGRISSVSASSGQNPVSSVGYDAAGHVTSMTYGSSDSDAFTFYPTTGRMQTYTYTVGSSPQTDSGALNWNTNGLLQSLTITDQINSANTQTCNYTHDDLGRIASSNCGASTWNQNFSYDPFGNITKTVPGGSTGTAFQPTYDYTNYTNRMTSSPYAYSGNNGAVTQDTSHSYGWDTATRLNTVDFGTSNGICITYDAMNRVVEQAYGTNCSTNPTSTAEVVYSPDGAKLAVMNASTLLKAFVSLPAGAQGVYNGSGLQYYRHPDWLGSSRLATTPSRTCYWDIAYAAFGEDYAPPSSGCVAQDLSFTGQNQDTVSSVPSGGQGGLYDFTFRKHSPVQGRWLSPDPSGLAAVNPSDPQSWNRYAYVGNRPTTTVDALGLFGIEPIQPPCDPSTGDGCGGGGYCPPEYGSCDPGCDPDFGCEPGPGPGQPIPPPPLPIGGGFGHLGRGGVWANNETLGLPGGLASTPLGDINDILSLAPNLGCGNTWGSLGFTNATAKGDCLPPPIVIDVLPVLAAAESGGGNSPKADSNYAAGVCVLLSIEQFRAFGGCWYTCTLIASGPWDPFSSIKVGAVRFKKPEVDAACGPGRFCPHILTIEVNNYHDGINKGNGKILSCSE